MALQAHVAASDATAAAAALERGCPNGAVAAVLLKALASEREATTDVAELVWTGPDTRASASRDTWVVVQELIAAARSRILLSCYTFHDARELLRPLGARMDAEPGLAVRFFVDVGRKPRDERATPELLREFADGFRGREWSATRQPEIFYDPRSLSEARGPRSVLHAKCVVIDDEVALVTSANLSRAAHERNIEAGALIRNPSFARALTGHFESLVDLGSLQRVPGF